MLSITQTTHSTTALTLDASSTEQELLSQLMESHIATLDEQKDLIDKLCKLPNFAIDDVIHEAYGGRLIDIAFSLAQGSDNPKLMLYLINKKGANLKRCQAVYALSPSTQTWRRIEDFVDKILVEIPEYHQPRFQVTVQYLESTDTTTLDLSLPEARKLARASGLFLDKWSSASAYDTNDNFVLDQLPKIDPDFFQNFIDIVIGRVPDTPTPIKHLASLLAAIRYLGMEHSRFDSAYNNLLACLDPNSSSPEQRQDYQDTLIEMTLDVRSNETAQSLLVIIDDINHGRTSTKFLFNTDQNREALIKAGKTANTDFQRARVRQLLDVFSRHEEGEAFFMNDVFLKLSG